jgi:acetyl esterase/lipase
MMLQAIILHTGLYAQDEVVHKVKVSRGISYSQVRYPGQDKMQRLCFDLYAPETPSDSARPLVITVFGGGFVAGTRDYEDMVEWCNRLAETGYAVASIDYRLMKAKKFSAKNLVRTGYMAAQDVSAAVRFFKAHSKKYNIDTNRIFLLGQSAGAVAILHALYMSEDERPEETFEEPALSPLHSTGTAEAQKQHFSVAGAVLLWGCIFRPDMIDADETTPVCLIHGGKDKILPVDSGYAFSIPGFPYAYGSQVIADRLKDLGTSSFEFHLLEQESHAFYFKYLCMFQLDALKFDNCFQIATDFMHRHGGL